MTSFVTIPLSDVIGDTSDIKCVESEFLINGLTVKCWKYFSEDVEPKLPIIGLHGGPAFTHGYILPLKLLARNGYSVILYDQAGCGKSTFVKNPEIHAPWLLTLEYYLVELEEVVKHYDLKNYFLYGSSWGTIVVQEYAVKAPTGLMGIILDGALCDAKLYIETQWRDRIGTLPTVTQKLLKRLTDNKMFHTPEYKSLNEVLSRHFTLRTVPIPDVYMECMFTMNNEIYVQMQGESEFVIGGVLKDWTITNRLHYIQVPALIIAGEYDTMTEECSMAIVQHIPKAFPLVIIPRASHCKLLEEPELCIDSMLDFLQKIESVDKIK